jgi:SAM-dependent methyltransferase
LYDFEKDKTWNEDAGGMLQRFFKETEEDAESLQGKLIFDAGCGNGLLDLLIAEKGAVVLAMDLSLSIEKAFHLNTSSNVIFIQGDVQFPPVAFEIFDLVHCSGVLICTNNTELSFACLAPCVKHNGKLSTWLYHPRKNFIHNTFNFLRRFTSKLPLRFQYFLYCFTLFPASYIVKRLRGNKQNKREMMIDILDWFSPEYRWEHTHEEAASWFHKYQYHSVRITTINEFGFNIIGIRHPG